jgi:phosphomannomutase
VLLRSSTTRRLFGTDGVRGLANREPMTPETMLHVAMAAGQVLRRGDHRHLVVIGKDTRLSGYMLEPALTSGFVAMGMDVVLVGPLPTPAIAMLTRSLRADLGVVISASHNPFEDNGIKFFGPDGYKLSDEIEAAIEAQIGPPATDTTPRRRKNSAVPSVSTMPAAAISNSSNRASRAACVSRASRSSSIARMAPPTKLRRRCSGNWAPRSSRWA